MVKCEGTLQQGGAGSEDTFELPIPMTVHKLIKRYEESDYVAVIPPDERPSPMQVSAVRGKLMADENPAPDFGLIGPY